MEFTMIKMDPFMMANGMKIKNLGRVKCYTLMVLSMTDNGNVIRCMAKEFLYLAMVIGTKEISIME